jgi:hypothetical protein
MLARHEGDSMNERSAGEREFHVWVNGKRRATIKAENINEALRLAHRRYKDASSCEVYGTILKPDPTPHGTNVTPPRRSARCDHAPVKGTRP